MTQASPRLRDRPLSPHISIWRWHITALTSIAHRATGMALYVGALILAGWVASLAAGPAQYFQYRALLASPLGQIVLFGLTLSIFYHLAHGVRHLFWDFGKGYQLKTANLTSVVAISFAFAASIAIWLLAAAL